MTSAENDPAPRSTTPRSTTPRSTTPRSATGARAGWAVLGAGSIARRFVSQLPSSGGELVAVGSAATERADALADEAAGYGFTGVRRGSYAEVLADPRVDAVYVATVHTGHARLVIDALEAGKAVLCEKPLAPNFGTVEALVDAARSAGVTLVEAFMYRFHPQTRELLRLVREGAIGEVTHIDASFAFRTDAREGRLYDAATAGGGILDVGGYPMSLARAVAGAARGAVFADPVALTAGGTLGPTGVDEWATAELTFASGITASVRCGIALEEANAAVVYGTRGRILLTDPWTRQPSQQLVLSVVGEEPRPIVFAGELPYALEADATVAARGGEAPEVSLDDSLGNALALDRWRAALGLRYPFEAEGADIPPVSGRPLRVVPDERMRYGEIPGVGKRMSRLVLGVDNQQDLAHASALFDHFVEHGGTAFDTAWLYGGGQHERRLGQWIRNRGIRDDLVFITKGAHTPHCDPESLSRQLLESLERQGTDYADIYLLHRDNEEVPVGEFVDVLDEHRRAGRIRVYGGSNWSPERVDAANAYARANGRQEFSVLSNHFGLAEAYDVPWPGCRHVTDAASKQWLAERRMPLLPWSSQARGFFARARPDDTTDAELVRCYYSDENFERLRRAAELGVEYAVPATAIALAYVLAQPFPTFPLFGPRSIAEARSSMTGLALELTPEQLAWLDLRRA
ncbi:MAG: aldo/keto reductase [Micrococcales bacterium]|nr:aldo/keto reductase [Micrococcales bacterium]